MGKDNCIGRVVSASFIAGLVFTGQAALAEQVDPDQGGNASEIVVTGSRLRESAVQDTPLAVSVLSASKVENLNASNITAISSLAPNLTVNRGAGIPTAVVSIRGFAATGNDISIEPGVAIYVDGVYQSIVTGSLADLGDVDRIEVLRGPQAALLGRSAGAGAVLIARSKPTGKFEGKVSAEYGSYDLKDIKGLINFPIAQDVLAGKVYANFRQRDGWVTNLAVPGTKLAAEKSGVVRGALMFTPASNLSVYLTGDYQWDRSAQTSSRNISNQSETSCRVLNFCAPDLNRRKVTRATLLGKPKLNQTNLTAHVDWSLNAIKLSSISGYRKVSLNNIADFDGSPFPLIEIPFQHLRYTQYSQELRISSQKNGGWDLDGKLSWIVGAVYSDSHGTTPQQTRTTGGTVSQSQRTARQGFSVFGSLDFEPVAGLTFSVGGRRTWDKIDHDYSLPSPGIIIPSPSLTQSADFKNTSFEGGAQYEFAADKMVYVRYAEGYRAGGFTGLPSSVVVARAFAPENSRNYEAGLKTQWFDRKLLLNVAVFDTKFVNLQRRISILENGVFIQRVTNAADARTRGVEVEARVRPTSNFTISGNIGYLDAKYTNYITSTAAGIIDLSGNPISFASKYTASANANYKVDLGDALPIFDQLIIDATLAYRDKFFFIETKDTRFQQPRYATVDLSATLARTSVGPDLRLVLYGRNIFDKAFSEFRSNAGGLAAYSVDDIGRTIGVRAEIRF